MTSNGDHASLNSQTNLPLGTERHGVIAPHIALPDQLVKDHGIIVEDGKIIAIVPVGALPQSLPTRTYNNGILAPGFVDIHGHGATGRSVNEGTDAAIISIAQTMLNAGVTTWLPTFSSAPLAELTQGLTALAQLPQAPNMARMPGAHLEGPYFSQVQRGAQPASSLRMPDDGSVEVLLEHKGAIRMISFAPELPGAIALTRRLVTAGIIAAAGHTAGNAADLYAAQEVGLSHVIHIYSGQSTTYRAGAWRVPGMLEGTLASDHLTVEMIADGKHLPVELMRIAHRALAGRLCLVSDATAGAGLAQGTKYGTGSSPHIVQDGVGMTLDGTSFAGSTTLLPAMIPIVASSLGLSPAQAIAMASYIPARAARLDHTGRIAVGFRADFALLSDDLKVLDVALGGRWISA